VGWRIYHQEKITPKCGITNELEQPARNERTTARTLSESNTTSMDSDKPRENMTSAISAGETLSLCDKIQKQEASKLRDVHDILRPRSGHSTKSNNQLLHFFTQKTRTHVKIL
jgi:hypothetical protein